MVTIYGIKNCSTMKKAFDWLEGRGIPFQFHDYKKLGITRALLANWADQAGWEKLLNTRGTTWRKLTPEQQAGMNRDKALDLMAGQPSLIKRPVVEHQGQLLVGFDEAAFHALVEED